MRVKKVFAGMMSAAMLLCMSTTAFAATINSGTEPGNSASTDVTGKYIATPQYNVDVTWEALQFTYTESGTNTWNPTTHQYDVNATGTWSDTANDVKVVNHSNVPVKAAFSYEKETGFEGIAGTMSVTSKVLNAGVVGQPEQADNVTSELTLSGALARDKTDFTKVGSVKVTITPNEVD